MSTPPSEDGPGTPKPRRAATERAMRRRERRLAKSPADRTAPRERTRRERVPRDSTADRTSRDGAADRTSRDRAAERAADRVRPSRDRRARRVRRPPDRPGFPTRRRALVRRWTALAIVLAAVGLVVVVLWTPLFGVRSVDVVGVRDLTTSQVLRAADVRPGTPMLRLDTIGIMTRVGLLPRVASVDVSRDWPSTVRITVIERDPVGILTRPDGTHLIDSTGFDYATVTTPPAGLPKIDLPSASAADPRTLSVVHVLAALPSQLRAQLAVIGAATPSSVTLTLANGKIIRWGDADESARKAAVLGALMTRPGKVYDVSSPDLPTIS